MNKQEKWNLKRKNNVLKVEINSIREEMNKQFN